MIESDSGDADPAGDAAGDAAKIHGLQDEIRDEANRAMPGRRAAFPAGTLVKPPFERPQGDENRDQPIKPDGDLRAPSKPPGVK
jgi:hypothetical protein